MRGKSEFKRKVSLLVIRKNSLKAFVSLLNYGKSRKIKTYDSYQSHDNFVVDCFK